MKFYQLTRKQFLPISLSEAWDFFSSPGNLSLITPSKLSFRILEPVNEKKIYAGQIIRYKITVPPGVRVRWVTEITDVNAPVQFIDEQKSGPYAFWQHRHSFKDVPGGVEMTDDLQYAIPLGWLGRLVHFLFVKREVESIFDYRYAVLEKRFSDRINNGPSGP